MANIHEIFLPIKGFEGYYEISNFGKVKSLPRKIIRTKDGRIQTVKERILKFGTGTNGYNFVHCRMNEKSSYLYIHRLVATHFVFNEYSKPCVNHLDRDKKNNIWTNLAWVTLKENSEHACETGLFKKSRVGKGNPNYRHGLKCLSI